MNAFNRFVTILVLLALLALVVALGINTTVTLQWMQDVLARFETLLTQMAASQRWLFLLARILLALLLIALLVALLWREVRPRRARSVSMKTEAGSRATVSLDSIARRLAWHIDQLGDVIAVEPHVTPRGKAVDVVLDVETSPDTDVPMKTDEVVAVAEEVLTAQMGLQVGKVVVHISHSQYTDGA